MELQQLQEKAGQYFENHSCGETVFHVSKGLFQELADIDESLFVGFWGGFAGTGRVCGAISAATAVLSAIKTDRENPNYRRELSAILRILYQDFELEYKSLNCRDITGTDFTNPEERKMFREGKKRDQVCYPLVKYVVKLVYKNCGKIT